MRWVSLGVLSSGVLSLAISACGGEDDSSTPIEQIPQGKKVIELDDPERRGLCDWSKSVGEPLLPPAGSALNCGGLALTWNGLTCSLPMSNSTRCTATVSEFKLCWPSFVGRLAEDPCVVLRLQSPGAAEEFVSNIPGCEPVGPCAHPTGS